MDGTDLEAAVHEGVVPADVAARLRNFSAQRRGAPGADEERFGLVGGLSDIMTAAGLALLLFPALMLLVFVPLAPALLLPATWLLARHFTAKRRLTLTSFVIFGFYLFASAFSLLGAATLLPAIFGGVSASDPVGISLLLVVAAGTSAASALWWLRFRLPVAVAVSAVAGVNAIIHLLHIAFPGAPSGLVSILLLLSGIALFVMAMRWDISDIRRETRRSDVAFWLHAAAGYQIAHSSFRLIFGVEGDPSGWDRLYAFTPLPPQPLGAMLALLLLSGFCVVALAVDRRSLLMSSLAFIAPAAARLTALSGPAGLIAAAMMLGALLLALSGGWTRLRRLVLSWLPPLLSAQLPRTALVQRGPRPVL